MIGWLKKRERPGRGDLLTAVVVRNELVQVRPVKGGARLTAPLKRTGLRGLVGARGGVGEKTFELDDLGLFVWESVDGGRTVEGCVRRFAEEKRVNLREAEVAVLAFLKMLARRGLVALVVPKADGKGGER